METTQACSSPYEKARIQRLEENKKRMLELGLTNLSRDLSNGATPPKGSPGSDHGRRRLLTKEKLTFQLRRSSRNTGGEGPEYAEVEIDVRRRARFDNTGGTRHYSRLYERKYASEEARMTATEKAEALKKSLPQMHGSFVKPMLQSHVTGGFWLGLPVAFCRDYLPKQDERIVLEDDMDEEWETVYLSNKTGLSGGWRGFSLDHGLVDGDALVFELVEPKRFKVHIIRVYGDNNMEAEHTNDVKVDVLNSAEKAISNKVRQKLIWVTDSQNTTEGEKKKESGTTIETVQQIKDGITRNENGVGRAQRIDSTNVEADVTGSFMLDNDGSEVKDVSRIASDSTEAHADPELADINDCMPLSKRLNVIKARKGNKQDGMRMNNDACYGHVKDASIIEKSSGKQSRDMTSYMRSRKQSSVHEKKKMQSMSTGIGVY